MDISSKASACAAEGHSAVKQTTNPRNKTLSFWACTMWALGAIFYCYEYYLRIAPSVMTSDLALAFKVDATALGNLSACYYYAYVVMQIPVGILMDRYGPRYILTMACLACAVGSFLFSATDILLVAGLGRFLVGFGSAFAYVGVLKLTTIWLPDRTFAMFAGFATALGMFGAIGGDITMTALVAALGWKATIFYSAVAGVALTAILWFMIRERKSVDYQVKADTANHIPVLKCLWIMCRNPQMWFIGVYGCTVFIVISVFAELWGIPFLRDVHHFSPETAAWTNSLLFLGFAIGGPIFGWYSDKIFSRCIPMLIGVIGAVILMGTLIYLPDLSPFAAGGLLLGVGIFASSQCLVFALARDNNKPELSGIACSFTNMLVMMGGVLLQPLVGIILDMVSSGPIVSGLRIYSAADYRQAMVALPICLIIGLLSVFVIKETRCQIKA